MSVIATQVEHPHPDEKWRQIKDFDRYKVSTHGRIRNEHSGRIMELSQNQFGVVQVGMVKDGVQHHRSVPLLVAKAFIRRDYPAFDTPINLDGDRWNNHVENLLWRPRWFAVKYNWQFTRPSGHRIHRPLKDMKTGEITNNSFDCAITYGLLEDELVDAIIRRTYVWPTYQQFVVIM